MGLCLARARRPARVGPVRAAPEPARPPLGEGAGQRRGARTARARVDLPRVSRDSGGASAQGPGRAPRAAAVVTPAYQAAATISEVVSRTSRAVPGATVYVVDDGSSDGTSGAGRGQGATVLVHPRNRGKGA